MVSNLMRGSDIAALEMTRISRAYDRRGEYESVAKQAQREAMSDGAYKGAVTEAAKLIHKVLSRLSTAPAGAGW
jgi:hypothetical protein